jgi:putative ABC transport system substrate-binding protein
MWRIGVLGSSSAADFTKQTDALRAGLRELGYVEGKNVNFEYRWAEGKYNQLPLLATELVQLKVDVIVTRGTPSTSAARNVTNTLPIVMVNVSDPVASGFAQNLARPGGNVTGFTNIASDVSSKQLEMLLAIAPKVSRAGVLVNPGNASHAKNLKDIQVASQRTSAKILPLEVRTAPEIDSAFTTLVREKVGGLIVLRDSIFNQQSPRIAALAMKHRVPSISSIQEYVMTGGLISYGSDNLETFRRAATYLDKIFRGSRPGDLPVEQPMKFELIINGKTAKALGLKIPQSLLIMADTVIE